MFDGELEYFCKTKDLSRADFYRKCQDAAETDPKAMHYIQILLSSAEYETFVRLMKIMKPIAKMKKDLKSDEKQSGGGGDSGGKASKGGDEVDEGEELEDFRAEEKSSSDSRGAKGGQDDDEEDVKGAK